jgi:rubrerythrin
MMSKIPIDLTKIKKENINKEILRAGLIAEYDAVNLYEQMAELTDNEEIKKVLLDIAKEEKEHVGEFQTLLEKEDPELKGAIEEGKEEVEELLKKG